MRILYNIIGIIAVLVVVILLKVKQVMSMEKQIFTTLFNNGIPRALALLIVAQSKHETAIKGVPFMSKQFLVNNNAFGYGYIKGNIFQSSDGGKHPEDGGHYAKYDSVEMSVRDVAGWYKRRKGAFFHLTTPQDFAIALKNNNYYTDTSVNYSRGVSSFYKTVLV